MIKLLHNVLTILYCFSVYENRHKENGGLKPRSPLLSPPILSPPHPMDTVDYNMEHVNGIIATAPKVANRKKSRESDEGKFKVNN